MSQNLLKNILILFFGWILINLLGLLLVYGKTPLYYHQDKQINKSINACILILCRNEDLESLKLTLSKFERNFNEKFNYPYVLLNNEPFSNEFKSAIVEHTKSVIEFGLINKEHWSIPDWINQTKIDELMKTTFVNITYATKISYHHMCRFYSGFFFRHELTLKYDYYLRIDPHVDFPCQIENDPFEKMKVDNLSYGFVIARNEDMTTIPSLWQTIQSWLQNDKNKQLIASNNTLKFIMTNKGDLINSCHFWNNFEIASFKLFRSQAYLSYFDYLDKSGGFYYERWGDAPVHTYYAVLMLNKSQIHRFENIGYGHDIVYNWPRKMSIECDANISRDETLYTKECTNIWIQALS